MRDYLHVDDVVDAYLALGRALDARALWGQAFNFSDERPVTVREIYEAVCDGRGQAGCRAVGARHAPITRSTISISIPAQPGASSAWATACRPSTSVCVQTVDWYADFFAQAAAS